MFDSTIYIERRKKLKSAVGSGLILMLGNEESPMNYLDNTYHFRQDSTFLYYFGLNRSGLAAVIDLDEDEELIYGNDLTIDEIVWMGSQPTIAEEAESVGVSKTGSTADLVNVLKAARANRKVHFLPPYRPEHKIKLLEWLDVPLDDHKAASRELITAVANQRNIKSAEEIERLDKIVSVTADMHFAAMHYALPGMTEAQVAAKVYEVALANGGDISFPIIATINGQTLHNHYHGNTLSEGDLFLLDAGAEDEMGYAGDMSSTMPVSPTFTMRQREIYEVALAAHEAALNSCGPGVNFKDVHFAACRVIFEGLKAFGLTKGDTDQAVAEGAHALFLPCGTGHLMGLDVHDMENLGEEFVGYAGQQKSTQFGLKSLRLGRPLETGMVCTIEPGIYFIPELIDLWSSEGKFKEFLNYEKINDFRDFGGIRNEEDVLITDSGFRVLGKPLAKTIDEVESARALAFA